MENISTERESIEVRTLAWSGAHYSLCPLMPSSIAAKQEEADRFHRLCRGKAEVMMSGWETLRDVSSVGH
jgi:hypothetical protein